MKIQRHVRQDFQPVYIKIETLSEAGDMLEIMKIYRQQGSAMSDPLALAAIIQGELQSIIDAGGVLP